MILSYNQRVNYSEAEGFLQRQRRLGVKLGLRNMARAMERLDHPERRFPSILVAGSKGKGSFCVFLEAILRAAGFRTGLYTSPHLVEVRERICTGGSLIGEQDFGDLLETLRRDLGGIGGALTYFEWLTVMAIRHFVEEGVQVGVFEVGLGGRFDATNILPAGLAVVTEIEKEHTEHLGRTLGEIAGEKGGIIGEGAVFCSGVTSPTARRSLAAIARRQGAQPRWLDEEATWKVTRHSLRGLRMDLAIGGKTYAGLQTAIPGRHQARNAALAVLAAEELRRLGFPAGKGHVREGLSRARWPGRCDYRRGRPSFFLDGSHTPTSIRALASTLKELFPDRRPVLLFGMLRDKNAARLAEPLFPLCRKVVLARPPEERGAPPEEVLRRLPPSRRRMCLPASSVAEGLDLAVKEAGRAGLVVVAGSLFLVGAVLALLSGGEEGPLRLLK